MKVFILGFVTAAALAVMLYFFAQPVFLQAKLGRMLDEDTVYTKSGDVIRGWIVDEKPDMIFIETEKANYSLPREKCAAIRKNVLGRYFRDLP
jgi:hypothetical protein